MHNHDDIENRKNPTVKQHLARRWWVYILIFFLIVGLITILVVIFAVVPSIAQNSIDGAVVQVDRIAITNPSISNITVSMNTTIQAKVPVNGARLSAQTFEMFLPTADNTTYSSVSNLTSPFAALTVGELSVKDVFAINVTGSNTAILDQNIYQQFSTQVLKNEEINLGIRSNPAPKLNIGPLKLSVNFQKIVKLKGFNMLRGMILNNATILPTPLEDGTNMLTDAIIPNSSSFIMQVGELTTNITIGGLALGFSVIKDLILHPGDNKVKVFTHLNEQWSNNPLVGSIVTQSNINITLNIISVISDGEHIPWLEKPMSELSPFFALLNPQAEPLLASTDTSESTSTNTPASTPTPTTSLIETSASVLPATSSAMTVTTSAALSTAVSQDLSPMVQAIPVTALSIIQMPDLSGLLIQ